MRQIITDEMGRYDRIDLLIEEYGSKNKMPQNLIALLKERMLSPLFDKIRFLCLDEIESEDQRTKRFRIRAREKKMMYDALVDVGFSERQALELMAAERVIADG